MIGYMTNNKITGNLTDTNSKRIAKNTLLLYVRMFVTMLIQLYTSRIVLKTLGVNDLGIYNVVGGVVTLFAFLNIAMSSSTQRYITFYLGKGDIEQLRTVFSHCFLVHVAIAVIAVILSETIGLWLLYNKMIIPEERMFAAFWVYQCSIISTVLMIFTVPFNSDIIAHEKMSVFAYVSIAEVVLKLLIVYLLWIISWDKLILYAILLVCVQIVIRGVYRLYCRKNFEETRIIWKFDRNLLKEIVSFVGWNIFGGLSNVLYSQGLNIMLNSFFGPVVNTARGFAVQVQNAILQFSQNFQTAINPQITKSYSTGDLKNMHNLIFKSARFTFMMLWILSLPVFLEADFLLKLWLINVPDWTVQFLRIMLCIIILDSVANPLMIASAATGRVKTYQIVIGCIMLMILPVAYLFLKLGFNPDSVFYVHLFFCIIAFIARMILVKGMINLSLKDFSREVLVKCLIVGVTSMLPYVIMRYAGCCSLNSFVSILIYVGFTAICILLFGITTDERQFALSKIKTLMGVQHKR